MREHERDPLDDGPALCAWCHEPVVDAERALDRLFCSRACVQAFERREFENDRHLGDAHEGFEL